jgi:hypothetical protein
MRFDLGFKMKTAVVAKHRREWPLVRTSGAFFRPLGNFVATAIAKFGSRDDFGCAVGTEIHLEKCWCVNAPLRATDWSPQM